MFSQNVVDISQRVDSFQDEVCKLSTDHLGNVKVGLSNIDTGTILDSRLEEPTLNFQLVGLVFGHKIIKNDKIRSFRLKFVHLG